MNSVNSLPGDDRIILYIHTVPIINLIQSYINSYFTNWHGIPSQKVTALLLDGEYENCQAEQECQ